MYDSYKHLLSGPFSSIYLMTKARIFRCHKHRKYFFFMFLKSNLHSVKDRSHCQQMHMVLLISDWLTETGIEECESNKRKISRNKNKIQRILS